MWGRLSSHKFRHRLLWTAGPVVVVGGLVAGAIAVGNTARNQSAPLTNKPAQVYKVPPSAHLTRKDRLALFQVSNEL